MVAVAILMFALAPVVTSAFKRTPADRVGVSYSGGPISGTSFQKVVEPGRGYFFNGFFSRVYLYPAGVSTYLMPDDAEGVGILEASEVIYPASDDIPVSIEVSASYRLNRDALQGFHESLGMVHEAYTAEGWDEMERIVVRGALSGSIQEALRNFSSEALISDPGVIAELESQIATGLAERLEESTGGRFFCSPGHESGGTCDPPAVVIGALGPPSWADGAGGTGDGSGGGPGGG